MSKGSARRPSQVPREKYADSHDRIFAKPMAIADINDFMSRELRKAERAHSRRTVANMKRQMEKIIG